MRSTRIRIRSALRPRRPALTALAPASNMPRSPGPTRSPTKNDQMITKGSSGAETALRVLRAMGVERIFASPGSDWAPLWEALAKPHGPDEIPAYLSSRHEETAVAMAAGYTKATGKLAAVVMHT